MKHLAAFCALASVLVLRVPSSSAEAPSFDPDQPFRQVFNSQMLRALLNQALDVVQDHLEVAGELSKLNPTGDQSGRLQFKLYPKGKSQSDEHLEAEGWFSFSPDSGRHDFHFRFQRPEDSPPSSTQRDDVL